MDLFSVCIYVQRMNEGEMLVKLMLLHQKGKVKIKAIKHIQESILFRLNLFTSSRGKKKKNEEESGLVSFTIFQQVGSPTFIILPDFRQSIVIIC